jgi:heavy metal translocating P-type ATPase
MTADKKGTRDYRELVVLSIVPVIVGILILISWALAHWKVGPVYLNAGVALLAILLGGYLRFISGFKDIFHRKITVSVFVTFALIATVTVGEFRAAAIVVFIMSVASGFESYTLDKTRKNIRNLLDLAPQMATVRRGEEEITIPVSKVQIGDIVVVRPGGRIPVDGIVVAGASSVNQAPITGESIPVEKSKGANVFSGTLNETGRLEIQTTKVGRNTTLARIVHLTEEAQATKAPVQTIADRFTTWFFPTILVLAAIGYFISWDIKIAVTVLLVACPCAFAIATPTAVTAGISNMAKRGILVKGGVFLELASKLDTLLVDKTGTFTMGKPKVVKVVTLDGHSEDEVLLEAAVGEKYSGHPLSRAVTAFAKERGIAVPDPDEFKIEIGKGIIARWRGKELLIGNEELLRAKGIVVREDIKPRVSEEVGHGRTVILVSYDKGVTGLISIADEIRPGTAKAIAWLKKGGIKKIIMLTGDNLTVAGAVAKDIGVDDFQAELLPEQKMEVVKRLQKEGQKVGMIGDGINDAPALAQADVGIAMGAAGTDVAIETAGVTLMSDDLGDVVDFVQMSQKVLRRIKLNIFFSIIYNVIGLTLSILGLLTPILAVTFQEAGCLTVVFSSTLLLWSKTKYRSRKVDY